ncbi:hypothetical protein HYT55_03880 [Candidatus Woesearchaeota archaeon]|nr:hypothetical protein [Candidatus Woesearchaeota archaeon]
MEESTIITLISLSLALAFGINFGFNAIYQEKFTLKFKKFKMSMMVNLKRRIQYIALKNNNEFESELNTFFKAWQSYQENIKDAYDLILKLRTSIFYLYLFSGVFYFSSLLEVKLFNYPIILIANLLFLLGLMIIFFFGKELFNLNQKISKYEQEKCTPQESFERIKNTSTNSK